VLLARFSRERPAKFAAALNGQRQSFAVDQHLNLRNGGRGHLFSRSGVHCVKQTPFGFGTN